MATERGLMGTPWSWKLKIVFSRGRKLSMVLHKIRHWPNNENPVRFLWLSAMMLKESRSVVLARRCLLLQTRVSINLLVRAC